MTTRKYKELAEQTVGERDIYRFLHNLKGIAGKVGLDRMERFAGSTLLYFSDHTDRVWTEAEWGEYLYPVLNLFSGEVSAGAVLFPDSGHTGDDK